MRKILFITFLICGLQSFAQIQSGRPSDAFEFEEGHKGMSMKSQWVLFVALVIGGVIIYNINTKNKK